MPFQRCHGDGSGNQSFNKSYKSMVSDVGIVNPNDPCNTGFEHRYVEIVHHSCDCNCDDRYLCIRIG